MRGKASKNLSKSAYSLVEVMIAMLLLTLVLLGIVSVFPTAHAFLRHSDNVGKATAIAQSVLEQQRKLPFASIANTSGSVTLSDVVNGVASTLIFNYTVSVTSQASDLKSVTVTVTWGGTVGRRTIIVSTLVFGQ